MNVTSVAVYATPGMRKLKKRLQNLGPPCDDYPKRKNGKSICKQYNITEEDYYFALQFQCGRCSVCGEPGKMLKTGRRRHLCIDHCHYSGRFRDLKCHSCNLAMGYVRNKADIADNLRKNIEVHDNFMVTLNTREIYNAKTAN